MPMWVARTQPDFPPQARYVAIGLLLQHVLLMRPVTISAMGGLRALPPNLVNVQSG
jgi:hypothetical protein